MTNIDELFKITEYFAAVPCSRPGVLDPCFNACLLLFKPDLKTYQEIMKLWRETTKKDTCPNDQVLLNGFYAHNGWKEIPYAYNIRRIFFRPLKSFHYGCCHPPKPWMEECRPSRKEARAFAGPVITVDDVALVFWKNFYEVSTEVRVRGLVEIYIVFHANARVSSCFKFFLPDHLTALEKSNYSVGLIL